jgi:FkbM family methyltransferase
MESKEFKNNAFYRLAEDKWVAAPVMHGQRLLWINLSDMYVSLECLNDRYEPNETSFVRSMLKPDSCFVDLGANIGWFSLLASTVIKTGRIVSFEPRPDTYKALTQTRDLNKLNDMWDTRNCAISDHLGQAYIVWAEKTNNPGGSFVFDNPAAGGGGSAVTMVRTLDSEKLASVDFIKMDVEGHELYALKGAKETISKCKPVIMCEVAAVTMSRYGLRVAQLADYLNEIAYDTYEIVGGTVGDKIDLYDSRWASALINVAFLPS